MKAGDKVIWTDVGHDGAKREGTIVAIFEIKDTFNKDIIGKLLYRLDVSNHVVYVFGEELEPVK